MNVLGVSIAIDWVKLVGAAGKGMVDKFFVRKLAKEEEKPFEGERKNL